MFRQNERQQRLTLNRVSNNIYNDSNIFTQLLPQRKGYPRREFPLYLRSLLSNPADPHYTYFKENIRNCNASMPFVPMGARIVQPNGRGPYTFRGYGKSITEHPKCIQMPGKANNLQKFMSLTLNKPQMLEKETLLMYY